ncbi:DUF447 domain-containing protein [Natronorarus salvus]|uniref:DUF447 domain-containing protein n=1 Tax=Natronorarus salvus TaxID=3117733 RepID=UPI002F260C46
MTEHDDDAGEWPAELDGVTESVVATFGPNGRWNLAALGLFSGDPVAATTWGDTRTRRNFEREGEGVVQFTRDPRTFVEAALGIYELDDPVDDSADAWVRVTVERIGSDERGGTTRETWALTPTDSEIRRETVPTTNRGYFAVIDATVAASRLDVPSYDRRRLVERLVYYESVVGRCGGEREREAFARIADLTGWNEARENESF